MAHLAGEVEHDLGAVGRASRRPPTSPRSASTTVDRGRPARRRVRGCRVRAVARARSASTTVTSAPPRREREREVRSDEAEPAGDQAPTPGERSRAGTASRARQSTAKRVVRRATRRAELRRRRASRRRAVSHTASSSLVDRRRATSTRVAAARSRPRNSSSALTATRRPGARRASSSSTASRTRALFTWSSTSKSLARSGHGRTSRRSAGGRGSDRRPRTRRPPAAAP